MTSPIKWEDIQHNAYTENVTTDWVALDENKVPIGRASDFPALARACPAAAYYVRAPLSPLDHDGDGRPGGTKAPRRAKNA